MSKSLKRALALAGVMMIGDATAYALGPKRYVRVWDWPNGPRWYKRMLNVSLNKRLGAILGATEAALGIGALRLAERA